MSRRTILLFSGIVMLALAGCQAPAEIDVPITIPPQQTTTIEPILPTPLPPDQTLIVCMQREPESLYIYSEAYLYGGTGREANNILQAIYDGPIDVLESGVEPVILQNLPSFESGTVRFEPIEVGEFEVYLNPTTLVPENLRLGDPYLPSGCKSADCISKYEGGLVSMDRMIVDFSLREDVTWSDGEPLTASDSVFSYDLDRSEASPTTKYLVDRTQSYQALDEWTLEWVGIPGYSDLEFETIFWHPLPSHSYGDLDTDSLLEAEAVNLRPLGWGPFMIEDWIEGDRIEMVENPNYFRRDEGLPYFDRVIYRFLETDSRAALQQLLTQECDVLDETLISPEIWPNLREYHEEGRLALLQGYANEVLRLDFNTNPLGRPGEAYFQARETRLALAACIDRQALTDNANNPLSRVVSSFHPLGQDLDAGIRLPAFDPDQGRSQLQILGWVDDDEDPTTAYVGSGVPGVGNGKRLEPVLLVPEGEQYAGMAENIAGMLLECGVQADVTPVSVAELTAGYPQGVIFNRKFDMVLWSWPDWRFPLCEMFATREIPSALNVYGVNASGFSNQDYDQSCDRILLGDHEQAGLSVIAVQKMINEELPALPLLQFPRLVGTSDDLCGLSVDSVAAGVLWNIEAIARGQACQ